MGKRGPKPRFLDVACPNEQCSLFGIAGKGNVTVYGTYQIVPVRPGNMFATHAALDSVIELTQHSMT
ncbi:MAG: hypothetical protein EHM34_04850 [Nitrosopumilales archaeon]|nr:MAG: hypothetical protein EHM34_04850 [Nitrosopumilales archaeon]